jgi:glycosyltransferase involved in cell wall biosynthesis
MDTIEISDPAVFTLQPLVSVGMLAYRHGKFIAQAIESVISQQCDFPFELIIGEDCSPDNTREIVCDYQRRYPHIIRILTAATNVGMQANSVRCLEAARGEYMAYCEGDDYWCDPTKLSRQKEVFRRYPECVLVFHPAFTVDAVTGKQGITGKWSPYSRMMSAREIILGDGGLIPTASMMLRREPALSRQPVWVDEAAVPDYALALWATCIGQVAYINRTMSAYRTNVEASWSSRHAQVLTYRAEHAAKIDSMFTSFLKETNFKHHAAAARMVSKYYSDPLVRIPGDRAEAWAIYQKSSSKMIGTDRALAWLAARHGVRLSRLKSLLRKVHTSVRLLRAMLANRRIDA